MPAARAEALCPAAPLAQTVAAATSVERAQRTHTEEFYEVTPCSFQIAQLNQELQGWERTYNTVRPHQALGYRTPQQFLAQGQSQRKENECH